MSKHDRMAAAQSRTVSAPPGQVGPLLVATVVRIDDAGVWAHVPGETHDRGPLLGDTTGLAVDVMVLLAVPANAGTPWCVGKPPPEDP